MNSLLSNEFNHTNLLYKIIPSEAVNSVDLVDGVEDGAVEHSDEEPVMLQHVAALVQLPLPVEGEDTWGFTAKKTIATIGYGIAIVATNSALCCFRLLLNGTGIPNPLFTLWVSVPGVEDHVILLRYPGQVAGQLVVYCGVDRFLE